MGNRQDEIVFTLDEVAALITQLNFDAPFMDQLKAEIDLMPNNTNEEVKNMLLFIHTRFKVWVINRRLSNWESIG
jgi:hypothetical protein